MKSKKPFVVDYKCLQTAFSSSLEFGDESWELGVGSLEFGVGSWELGVGSWELVDGSGEFGDGSLEMGVWSWENSYIRTNSYICKLLSKIQIIAINTDYDRR